jgi:hypothetical protein
MSTRALTLAVRLLTTACAGAALGTMTGCPFIFSCPEPWSDVETVELGTEADILAVAQGGSYDSFIAVGVGGVVVHHDAESGMSSSNPVNVDLRGVLSLGSTTIVVGDGGTILSSPDGGATWEARDATISDDLVGVAYGTFDTATLLVAISSGQVLLSTDEGATWAVVPAPAEGWGTLRAAFATHDELWVIGEGGSAWASKDGAAWLRQDLGSTAAFIGGGRVSGDAGSSYASSVAVATADGLLFRAAESDTWEALDASFDGPIVAYGGGFVVTTNGSVYDVDEDGAVVKVTNVGLVPLTISGDWDGFIVAGEGGNAARVYSQQCVGGRPWVIDGQLTTAALVGEIPPGDPLAEALARAWAQDGLYEHASVASFARVVYELMSVGAPAELIRATQAALRDEIEHARLCFALASRYAGVTLGSGRGQGLAPGPLPLVSNFANSGTVLDSRAGDPAAIALAVFEEGCINESMAAAEAAVAAQACREPETQRVLERIAADETRHAALAWRTLRWLLDSHPGVVAPALRRCVASTARPLPTAPFRVIQDVHALRRHGRLSSHERAAIHRRVFAEMIAPLAGRLCALASQPALA